MVQVTGNTLSTDKLTLLGGSAYSTVGISSGTKIWTVSGNPFFGSYGVIEENSKSQIGSGAFIGSQTLSAGGTFNQYAYTQGWNHKDGVNIGQLYTPGLPTNITVTCTLDMNNLTFTMDFSGYSNTITGLTPGTYYPCISHPLSEPLTIAF